MKVCKITVQAIWFKKEYRQTESALMLPDVLNT